MSCYGVFWDPGRRSSFILRRLYFETGEPMAWFALARVLFVAAVAYAAILLHPLPFSIAVNIVSALGLAALVVLFESRLRVTAVTHVLCALIGCTLGLG